SVLPDRWSVAEQAAIHALVYGPQFGIDVGWPPAQRRVPEEQAAERHDDQDENTDASEDRGMVLRGKRGGEQDDERHCAIPERTTDETDSQASRFGIPLRHGGATCRVDDACAATAQ